MRFPLSSLYNMFYHTLFILFFQGINGKKGQKIIMAKALPSFL
jgi:hypothetical protein